MRVTEVDLSRRAQIPLAATLDAVGWGLFLMWVGTALFAQVGWAIFLLGAGVLVLVGQAARGYVGSRVDWSAVALGAFVVVAAGARALELQFDDALVPAWFVPSMFVGMGLVVVVTAWRRWRRG